MLMYDDEREIKYYNNDIAQVSVGMELLKLRYTKNMGMATSSPILLCGKTMFFSCGQQQ